MALALIYGYGHGDARGLHPQAQWRCWGGTALYRHGLVEKLFLTAHAQKDGVRLCDQMSEVLQEGGVPEHSIIIDPRGGNTAGETDVFLDWVRRHGAERLYAVSTWYHLPRIKLLWEKRKHAVKLVPVYHGAKLSDVVLEIPKMLKAGLFPHLSSKQIV